MDHITGLDRFQDAEKSPLLRLPWLGFPHGSEPRCSFFDYPRVHGFSRIRMNALRESKPEERSHSHLYNVEAIAMFQSWLFVGALEHIFQRRIASSAFLESHESETLISTRLLLALLEDWMPAVRRLSSDEYSDMLQNLSQVLAELGFWCFKLSTFNYLESDRSWQGIFAADLLHHATSVPLTEFDHITKLVTLVGEFFVSALSYLRFHRPDTRQKVGSFSGNYTQQEKKRLVLDLASQGWCPYIALRLRKFSFSVAEYARFWPVESAVERQRHHHCTARRCVGYQIEPNTYRIKHTVQGCSCNFLAPDIQKITDILESGAVPILRLSSSVAQPGQEEVLLLDVQNAVELSAIGYAAISHVWSDGMGSTTESGLPTCVVQKIAEAANDCTHQYFWIDSLCVPKKQDIRDKAIRLMAKTYKDAAVTIVMDSFIAGSSFGTQSDVFQSNLLILATCPWMQRLWTLQEALLSRSLVFQFHQRFVSAEEIVKSIVVAFRKDFNPVTGVLGNSFMSLLKLRSTVPAASTGLRLGHVYRMLSFRTSSRTSDEVLAIAGLFNVDTLSFHKLDAGERMRNFWTSLRLLPSDIIFANRVRMSETGFRWAPTSMMSTGEGPEAAEDTWAPAADSKTSLAECRGTDGLRGNYQVLRLDRLVSFDEPGIWTLRLYRGPSNDNSLTERFQYLRVTSSSSGSPQSRSDPHYDTIALRAVDISAAVIMIAAALLEVQNPNESVESTYLFQGSLVMRNMGLFNVTPGVLRDFGAEATTVTMPITIL